MQNGIDMTAMTNAATLVGIETLGRAITERFKSDPSAPGINLSYLPNGQWYGSILRYTERLGQGKVVLLKCKRATLEEVITELEYAWRDYVTLNPLTEVTNNG